MTPESCPSVAVTSRGPRGWPCRDTGLFMAYLGRVLFIRIDRRLTPHAFERFLQELGSAIDLQLEGHSYGIVYDVPDEIALDAVRRRRIAEVLCKCEHLLTSTTAGLALVSRSKITRGIVEAILWMSPPSFAHTSVDTVEEALEFIRRFVPEVDPEAYAFEYLRLLARNGILHNSARQSLAFVRRA